MHGQCDARLTINFKAAECHHHLAGTKLYCLMTEAHGCERTAQSCYMVKNWPEIKLATFQSLVTLVKIKEIALKLS